MKMKRVFTAILAAASLALALTGCANAGDTEAAITSTENVVFTATPSQKAIIVSMEDGSKQKLELLLAKDLYDPSMMKVDDYNFDGYMDIAFPSNYNEKNTIYQLWLYDADAGEFVEYTGFGDNYNPTLDAENKQIHTVAYSDPVTTSKAVLEWRDGELICLQLFSETQDGKGNILTTEFAYNEETQKLELVKSESTPIEGYEELTGQDKE